MTFHDVIVVLNLGRCLFFTSAASRLGASCVFTPDPHLLVSGEVISLTTRKKLCYMQINIVNKPS